MQNETATVIEITQRGTPGKSYGIQIPRTIHAAAKELQAASKRAGFRPSLPDIYVHLAWKGLAAVDRGEVPVFAEMGIQPTSDFVGTAIAYPGGLFDGMLEIQAAIKRGDIPSKRLAAMPSKPISMRCIFITLIQLGLKQ